MSKITFLKSFSLAMPPRLAGAIFLLLLVFPAMASAQFVNPQFTTVSDGSGGLVITGFTASGSGLLTIPSTINNLTVTAIGANAFRSNSLMTGVSIPNTVTEIGLAAFVFTGLTSVTIPASVNNIQPAAFGGCVSLTSIAVSAQSTSYSSLNGVLFDKTQATLVAYPAGASSSYTIPNSVTKIEDDAFAGCTNLISVSIPNSVTTLGLAAFEECTKLAGVTIPTSITDISEQAFESCSGLTSVTIPASVTSIGQLAFHSCTSLASATFLGDAPTMAPGVFRQTASGFTVTYYDGATGFGWPTWYANSSDTYPAYNLETGPDALAGGQVSKNLYRSSWFGYYTDMAYPLVYEYNLGFEYVYPAGAGVYLYDYTCGHFWYTQGSYYPFIYDFSLQAFIYYYPGNGSPRYFHNFGTGLDFSE